MGTTYSSETACGNANDDAADAHSSSNTGFSKVESQHLTQLRTSVCQQQQQKQQGKNNDNFLLSIWKCSRDLAAEAEDGKKFATLLDEFPSIKKMNSPLERIFMNHYGDEQRFLETISNILGLHGHSRDAVDLVCNALCNKNNGEGEAFLAEDAIEFCFEIAAVLHFLVQGDVADLMEQRSISKESNMMIQSMANSLLRYAKNSREDQYYGGYAPELGAASGSATASNNNTAKEEGQVTKREFLEWQRKVVPDLIYCSVTKFCHAVFFPTRFSSQHHQQQPFPFLRSAKEITSQTTTKLKEGEMMPISSAVFGKNFRNSSDNGSSNNKDNSSTTTQPATLLSPPIFAFASISTPKFGCNNWYRIFAGAENGWTWHQLEHSILGYEGPTLLVMQAHHTNNNNSNNNKSTTTTVTLGAYTASKWEKNKRDFFGTSDCFLFQLHPTLRVLKPLPKMGTRGGHYMYFHSNTNKVNATNPTRKDELAEGLGFGGTVRNPRLFIDSHLEEVTVSHQDTSFEEGYLGLPPSETNDPFSSQTSYSSSKLHIDALEIYAVGDAGTITNGFRAQYQHRDIADATLRNARTVDKAAFLGDMRNGVIETKAFAHRGQVDGRAHGCLKGEEGRL
mmetsp:Transcript_27761/g.58651  ORF Transcript_27761/g.58651 Transcript_27761/m.58651 type:complete len:621 (-) Transcript_27761:212-2074(-)